MDLLELPPEIFKLIVEVYVHDEAPALAAEARQVCRKFNPQKISHSFPDSSKEASITRSYPPSSTELCVRNGLISPISMVAKA
jgi:hypothetical protein